MVSTEQLREDVYTGHQPSRIRYKFRFLGKPDDLAIGDILNVDDQVMDMSWEVRGLEMATTVSAVSYPFHQVEEPMVPTFDYSPTDIKRQLKELFNHTY